MAKVCDPAALRKFNALNNAPPPDKEQVAKACEDDRLWFKERVGVKFRLRPAYPGEMPKLRAYKEHSQREEALLDKIPQNWQELVLVHEISPDNRMRLGLLGIPNDTVKATQAALENVWKGFFPGN